MANQRGRRDHQHRSGGHRGYPRTARINEALREVIAEELETLDDDRLVLVTVTGVAVDPDLRRAIVYFSALTGDHGVEDAAHALQQHRIRLQAAVGRQIRMKFTPELLFRPDPAILEGDRIESIIRTMARADESDDESGERVVSAEPSASNPGRDDDGNPARMPY